MNLSTEAKRNTMIAIPITAVLGLIVGTYLNLSNQTAVAINVARQHGEELLSVRDEVAVLRGEIRSLNQMLVSKMDDRFRGSDARAMEERLMDHIERIEKRLDRNGI